jgi:hypothetical protein
MNELFLYYRRIQLVTKGAADTEYTEYKLGFFFLYLMDIFFCKHQIMTKILSIFEREVYYNLYAF